MDFKIDKAVSISPKKNGSKLSGMANFLKTLEINDSFLIEGDPSAVHNEAIRANSAAKTVRYTLIPGFQLLQRKRTIDADGENGIRFWRIS